MEIRNFAATRETSLRSNLVNFNALTRHSFLSRARNGSFYHHHHHHHSTVNSSPNYRGLHVSMCILGQIHKRYTNGIRRKLTVGLLL